MGMKSSQAGLSSGYRFGVAVNVVVICVLGTAVAIGIVAAVRQLSYQTDLRFDTTHDRRYSLDPLSKNLLRDLEAPLRVTFFWGFDEDLRKRVLDAQGRPRGELLSRYYAPILQEAQVRVRRVLQEWNKVTPHLELAIESQERAAARVEQTARDMGLEPDETINRVIFRHAGRSLEIPLRRLMVDMQWGFFPTRPGQQQVTPQPPRSWRVREELVAALRSITAGETTPIGIATGFNARIESESSDHKVLVRVLESEGYSPRDIDIRQGVPQSLEAIIVGAPSVLDSRSERALRDFEARGGRLLLFTSPARRPGFDRILQPYGVSAPSQRVADDRVHRPPHQSPGFLESVELCAGSHPIISSLKKRVRLYLGRGRPLKLSEDKAPGAERTPLLQCSPFSSVDTVQFDARTDEPRVIEGRRRTIPSVVLGAALRRKTDVGSEARLVVFGSEDVLDSRRLLAGSLYGNRDLLVNAMAWLTDRESSIGLIPRTEVEERWVASQKLETPFTVVAVIVMPLLAILGGLVVFFVRRS